MPVTLSNVEAPENSATIGIPVGSTKEGKVGFTACNTLPMKPLLAELCTLRLAPLSEDTNRFVARLAQELPFTIHTYNSGEEINGWGVPQMWKAVKATIHHNGKLIYDGMHHPLGVVGYSTSFTGKVSLETLKKHLYYHPTFDDALVYHCDYYYKPWTKDWGLSIPKTLYDSLPEGEYDVDIETVFEDGMMKVMDYFLPGDTEETIIINAHNCHAGQANDDISGVVVGVEMMRRLQQQKNRHYSYRLIVAPEHFGTVMYLENCSDALAKTFKYAIFIESVGNDHRFALQESFTGKDVLDRMAYLYFQNHHPDFESDRFRMVVGNDENVWEAPGYEIPCISISRFPYPEYHSSRDNADIILEEKLEETVDATLSILEMLETNYKMQRQFKGLVALSNPKYDLYIPTFDPSTRPTVSNKQRQWNNLMSMLVRHFEGTETVLDIAEKYDVDFFALRDYILKFEEKGLVTLHR